MAVRVKISGITRAEDLQAACNAGADALGFVFYAKSPRDLRIEQAAALVAQLPPFVQSVGLFGAPRDALERVGRGRTRRLATDAFGDVGGVVEYDLEQVLRRRCVLSFPRGRPATRFRRSLAAAAGI